MSRISDFLKINGKNMPTPDENVVFDKEPLWSSNAGRTASGLFVGDIVAEKRVVTFTFTQLDSEEISMIEKELNTFYTIDFIDPFIPQKRITMQCYKPPRSYPFKKIVKGSASFDSFTLKCIER